MSDERANAAAGGKTEKRRSTSILTILIAFGLGIAAQRTGVVEGVVEEVRNIRTPDFDECVEQIMDKSSGRSVLEQQVDYVRSRFSPTVAVEAEDIVTDAMIAVCDKVAGKDIKDVVRYFAKAVKNRAVDEHRKKSRLEFPGEETIGGDSFAFDPEVTASAREQLALFKECCERMNEYECTFLKAPAKARLLGEPIYWDKIRPKGGKPMSERQARRAYNAIMQKLQNTCPGLDDSFFK